MKREALRYLYGGTSLSLVIRVGGVGLLFAANILLARVLPQASYGTYAYIVELVAVAAVLGTLGFDQIAIRELPDRFVEGDRKGMRRFIIWALGVTLAMTLAIGAAFLFARNEGGIPSFMRNDLLLLAVLMLAALSMLRIGQESMRALGLIGLSQVVEQVLWPLSLMILAGALLLMKASTGVGAIVSLQIAVFAMGALALFSVLYRAPLPQGAILDAKGDGARQWFAAGVPLSLAAALSIVLNRGDILALGSAVGAAQIAAYTAASRYAALLVLGLAAASAAAASVMRDRWRKGDLPGLQQIIDRAAGFSALFAIPFALLFLAFPEPFLQLFGPGFVIGATALRLLVIGQLINALSGPVALIVVVCDLPRVFMIATACSVAMLLILLAVLIPLYGLGGAAIATLVSLSTLNLGLGAVIWQKLGVRPFATPGAVVGAIGDMRFLFCTALRQRP